MVAIRDICSVCSLLVIINQQIRHWFAKFGFGKRRCCAMNPDKGDVGLLWWSSKILSEMKSNAKKITT